MEVLVFMMLFLAMTGHSSATYCLCKDSVTDQTAIQKAIDYACGAGADCSAILQNGVCYSPNTPKGHCDYAVNSYFQRKGQGSGTCDFSGVATPSTTLPSGLPSGCVYQSTPSSSTTPSTTPPSTTTPSTTPPSTTTPSTTPSTTTPSTTPSVYGLGPTGSGLDNTNYGGGTLLQNTNNNLLFPLAFTTTILWFSGFLLLWV